MSRRLPWTGNGAAERGFLTRQRLDSRPACPFPLLPGEPQGLIFSHDLGDAALERWHSTPCGLSRIFLHSLPGVKAVGGEDTPGGKEGTTSPGPMLTGIQLRAHSPGRPFCRCVPDLDIDTYESGLVIHAEHTKGGSIAGFTHHCNNDMLTASPRL